MAKSKHRYHVGIATVMGRCGLGVWLLTLGAAAMADQPPLWQGYWAGNVSWCARAGDVGDQTPTWYGRDGFFGIEWSCDITSAQPTGHPNSWAMHTTCLDAGFEYTQSQIFVVTYEDRLLILDETGVTANLVRCGKGQ